MDESLSQSRRDREQNGLQRELRWIEEVHGTEVVWEGQRFTNFSSNDYLGLAQHPKLKIAAREALAKFGAGAGASRLICGTLPVHQELEAALAKFKGTEGALSFANGYAAAIGAITALVEADDVVILDKLSHASLIDGARLSGAKMRIFKHNDADDLEDKLRWARDTHKARRILVVTESVFSMDGDCAPLREIAALKERYGAWLMVDEAHGLGVLGPARRGLAEELGVANRIEVQMGTLGKATGAAGGFIAGSAALIDHLVNSSRAFIFSTAPPPAAAAAARAGIEVIASEEGAKLRERLIKNVRRFQSLLPSAPTRGKLETAIMPVLIGNETRAVEIAAQLKERGFLIPAIRYPTVAKGAARLRITLSALHTMEQINALAEALGALRLAR